MFVESRQPRGVAQSGSAPGWGPGGRRFKSCLPDSTKGLENSSFWVFLDPQKTVHGEQTGNKLFENLHLGASLCARGQLDAVKFQDSSRGRLWREIHGQNIPVGWPGSRSYDRILREAVARLPLSRLLADRPKQRRRQCRRWLLLRRGEAGAAVLHSARRREDTGERFPPCSRVSAGIRRVDLSDDPAMPWRAHTR